MYEYELPDESTHLTERLAVVVDVTTDGCGVTRSMRNTAIAAVCNQIGRFNLVVDCVPVRTEVDGAPLLES